MKTTLRWFAIPFAAIVGAYIAYLFISLWIRGNSYGFEIYNGVEIGSITQIILAIAAQAIFGAAFVYCGAYVAPKYNRVCAIVLASILCTISVISYIYMVLSKGFGFIGLVHTIATMIGAIATASVFETEETDNEFKTLFDSILKKGLTDESNHKLINIVTKQEKEWKQYCLSRKSEFRPRFRKGDVITATDEDSNTIVNGKVDDVLFDIVWWKYKVIFNEEISINNSWLKNEHLLTDKQIQQLSKNILKCSFCHYTY